jgi:hypothetical protein
LYIIYTIIEYYPHKLQNITQKYLDEFASIENIPLHEIEWYELANDLIQPEKIKKFPEQPGKIYILAIPNILLIPS